MIAKVIVDIASSAVDKIFDYIACDDISVGMRVLVPFGNRHIEGYVIGVSEKSDCDECKLKHITSIVDGVPILTKEQLEMTKFLKDSFHIGTADSIRLMLPPELRSGKAKEIFERMLCLADDNVVNAFISKMPTSAKQQRAIIEYLKLETQCLQALLNKKFGSSAVKKLRDLGVVTSRDIVKRRLPYTQITDADTTNLVLTEKQKEVLHSISANKNRAYLLHGITGSGKTEIYMRVINNALAENKTALMLVPEISLTPQVMSSFRERFGDKVALLHSGLSVGERFDEWKRILIGDAKIVVGARSAIFAPIKDLGVIIIDEEHESSYNSESHPRFVTSSIAEFRRGYNCCTLILGSATPSMVSYHKAITGEYQLLEMPERINGRKMPRINIVDMGMEIRLGNPDIFSNALKNSLEKCIKNGNQAILFINRRGFASFVQCRECGWVAKCPDCDVSLALHKEENCLKCHYCGNKYKIFSECPECHSENLKYGAIGTEKVVEELYKMFPDTKILRMDNDSTKTKDAHLKILEKFKAKEAQILVGTQMVAKGHDFPSVTLVGIIEPDLSLYQTSYLANEKTFALVTQVAGRAGRADKEGEIILQSYSPNHYVYRMAKDYDYLAFYKKEINIREITKFPPFSIIVRILFTSFDEVLAKSLLKVYYSNIEEIRSEKPNSFFYLNKMKSPINRIMKKFRFQILMRIDTQESKRIIDKIFEIDNKNKTKNVQTFIEVNAQDLR